MSGSTMTTSHNQHIFRPFPLPQTGRQWFYLAFLQGFGAGLVDGGLNFLVAWAMYHNQPVVKMWVLAKNTVAGDLGVTPIIQCIASMLITSTLVHTDLHHKAVRPLAFVYPHVEHLPDPRTFFQRHMKGGTTKSSAPDVVVSEAKSRPTESPDDDTAASSPNPPSSLIATGETQKKGFTYYYWMLIRFIFEGTEKNILLERVGVANWFGRVLWTAAQGAAIGIIFGFPLWCLAIVILGPIYGTKNMGGKWAPEAIKAVYGAAVGWVTNPVIATLALGSQAEHHLILVENEQTRGGDGQEVLNTDGDRLGDLEASVGVPTIHEDEELDVPRTRFAFDTSGASPVPSIRRPSTLTVPQDVGASPNTFSAGLNQTPTRPRAGTVSSRISLSSATSGGLPSPRPPFIASISNMPQVTLAPPITSTSSVTRPSRPRRATVSSQVSSNSSFSYALGGTGGRARRLRAESVYSARSAHFVENLQSTSSAMTSAPIIDYHSSSTPSSPQPFYQPSLGLKNTVGRQRANTSEFPNQSSPNSLAVPVPGSHIYPLTTTGLVGEREEGRQPAVWDVFGRTESAPAIPRRKSEQYPSSSRQGDQ